MSFLRRFLLIMLASLLPMLAFQIHNELVARALRVRLVEDEARRLVDLVSAEQQQVFAAADQLLTFLSVDPMIRVADRGVCNRVIQDLVAREPLYLSVIVLDTDGTKTCGTSDDHPGSPGEFADRRYFQDALRDSGLAVGGYVIGRASRQAEIQLARAFHDADGAVAGVVAVAINLRLLTDRLALLSLPPLSTAMVTDRDGVILARAPNDGGLVGQRIREQDRYVLEGADTRLIRVNSLVDGRRLLIAWASPGTNPMGLSFDVGLDEATAFADITAQNGKGWALVAAGVLASALLAVILRQLLMNRPFDRLLMIADRLGAGDLSARCAIAEDGSEFGRLSGAFNRMAAALEEREKALIAANDMISERRLAAAEQQLLTDRLEARVREEIASRQAAQAAAARAEQMQALGALAGGMAHDFNNVLQAIGGAATLIEAAPTQAAKVSRLARLLLAMVERGGSVTQRLLTFSRRADLRTEPLDAGIVLEETVELLSHSLGGAVDLRIAPRADGPMVLADKRQLQSALINLAANARDAMPDGGEIWLSVTAVHARGDGWPIRPPALEPGEYVCFTVADRGVGMDAATLARALEPFFTTKPPGAGTGLGLSTVQGFAEQSGGALRIESTPQEGTSVYLWLPAAVAAPSAALPAAPAMAPAHRGFSCCLLLVDDDDNVRDMLAEGLQNAGHRVIAAASGATALSCLADNPTIDVLIADFWMPGMDGQELIARAHRLSPDLPAILLTGNVEATRPDGGCYALVYKPVRLRDLIEKIEALPRIATPEAAQVERADG